MFEPQPQCPLRYFLRVKNVGDRINPDLIAGLFGLEGTFLTDNEEHVLGIGSILSGASPLSHVWGTGMMHPQFKMGEIDPSKIHALRGKLTYGALQKSGLSLPDVPLEIRAF